MLVIKESCLNSEYPVSNFFNDFVLMAGLNDLIPDHLLSIFDENELEMLLCGACTFSLDDLKGNHILVGSNPRFLQVRVHMSKLFQAIFFFNPKMFFFIIIMINCQCSSLPTYVYCCF